MSRLTSSSGACRRLLLGGHRTIHTTTTQCQTEDNFQRGGGGRPQIRKQDFEKMVSNEKRGVFRVLDIGKPKPFNRHTGPRAAKRVVIKATPREKTMKPDQDWPSAWPAARTFHPASVPLPIRQGFTNLKAQVTPHKYANVELLKIHNFLHLTPPAIKRHCDSLKKFCTKWPEELNDEDLLEAHFPLTEISSDYLNASSSIRDSRARVITIKVDIDAFFLDKVSREKFIRLVGAERYDPETNTVTISADRCPYRKQNREYCEYLLKALYYESRKREDWEQLLEECDKVEYEFDADAIKENSDQVDLELAKAKILNDGEDVRTLSDYKAASLKFLKLRDDLPTSPTEISARV